MTTAAVKLAEFGVSMEQAHAWLMANLSSPAGILAVCANFGVTNAMLGEIAGWPGAAYTSQQVQGFFAANGLNSATLDGPATGGPTVASVFPAGASEGSILLYYVELTATTTAPTEYAVSLNLQTASMADFSGYETSAGVTFTGHSLIVPAGVREFEFTIHAADDALDEDDEEYLEITIGGYTTTGFIMDGDEPEPPVGEGSALLPTLIDGFASTLDFNDRTGILATSAIRAQVLANATPTFTANYWALFDPARFEGSADGQFTPAELGVSHLGTISATKENIESLFYGTFLDIAQSIDIAETGTIGTFFMNNLTGIVTRNPAVIDQYVDLFVQAESTPTSSPVNADSYLANKLVVGFIGLAAGSGSQTNIFEQLLTI